jgi:hypothetical protein
MRGLALAVVLGLAGQPVLAEVDEGAIAASISRYWDFPVIDAEARDSLVVVRVTFARDNKPTDFQLIEAYGASQAGIDRLFDAARRAVMRAYLSGELPLSPGDYETWQVMDLVFDANGIPVS